MTRETTTLRRAQISADAREEIRSRFTEPDLTLDDVAGAIDHPRRTVQRALIEHGNRDFRSYLRDLRMGYAAHLLRSTSLPVREIAAECAYRQPAQFAKAFRRQAGQPPREYRRSRTQPESVAA